MSINYEMNVLIVDDQKTMLRIIRTLLNQIGFKNVYEATDANKAISLLREENFGLIISDWNMEPVTGIEFLKIVRASPAHRALPFIMVTAESKVENIVAAKQAGVSNYIVKPFNADTLRAKVEAVLQKAA